MFFILLHCEMCRIIWTYYIAVIKGLKTGAKGLMVWNYQWLVIGLDLSYMVESQCGGEGVGF